MKEKKASTTKQKCKKKEKKLRGSANVSYDLMCSVITSTSYLYHAILYRVCEPPLFTPSKGNNSSCNTSNATITIHMQPSMTCAPPQPIPDSHAHITSISNQYGVPTTIPKYHFTLHQKNWSCSVQIEHEAEPIANIGCVSVTISCTSLPNMYVATFCTLLLRRLAARKRVCRHVPDSRCTYVGPSHSAS